MELEKWNHLQRRHLQRGRSHLEREVFGSEMAVHGKIYKFSFTSVISMILVKILYFTLKILNFYDFFKADSSIHSSCYFEFLAYKKKQCKSLSSSWNKHQIYTILLITVHEIKRLRWRQQTQVPAPREIAVDGAVVQCCDCTACMGVEYCWGRRSGGRS